MKKSLLALTLSSMLIPLANAYEDLTPNLNINGGHLKTINEVMGGISKSDMQGYKALFMMADNRYDKAMVVKMMIINETSTSNIISYLAKNEAFTNAYPELFDGTDFQGNPKPTQEFEDLVNGKRNAQWNKEVANFYSDLEGHISSLEGDDLQKAINLLDSISIQGRTSLLETMQNNGYLADAESDETYSDEVIEEKLREKNTEGDINPPLWESPKDGSAAKKAKEIMGSVSRGDMDGYKAIYALAETKEQKKAVLGMMITNETSASDITKFLANNDDFVEEFGEEFFELDENGNVVKDKLGNPKLILDADGNSPLETIIGEKRNAQWSDKVGDFYSDLEEKISGLSDEDKQSALNLLDSITIDGRNSLLDKMNGNGYLKDVTDENGNIIVPIADPNLQDELIGDKEKELRDRHEVKDIDSGKKFVDEISKVTEDSEEAQQFVDDYISAEDEQKQEQASEVVSKATAEQIALMKTFTFTIPASESNSQTETNLWEYLNGVANGDIDPEVAPIDTENFSYTDADVAKFTAEVKGMKVALTEQFTTIQEEKAASKQVLVQHLNDLEVNARTELQGAKGKLQHAVTGEDGLQSVMQAMMAKMDVMQARIEELESSSNPSVPENGGINTDLQVALETAKVKLETAGQTLNSKMQTAKSVIQEARKEFASGRNSDVGINPPSNGAPSVPKAPDVILPPQKGEPNAHEFGSTGEGQAVAYVQSQADTATYAMEANIEALEGQIAGMNSRIDDVYEDLDSTMATAQAVTAARPYIGYGHTSAFGVGLGGAGDQSAIAVGYAHKVTENWTLNGNVSGTKGNDVNVSAGVGASYSW
ncbi:YadA C-terminal domain-containing protein [uncultured Vibrio sp.]|uniref:YadA C-terminal domain-containing protein n=1 Tax=uncultured Vibrio sp. TaxID=114054 RepID=UPI002609ACE0|nr:YadA C-terminal domain-containing protein [uncultured Vibrio sp.]